MKRLVLAALVLSLSVPAVAQRGARAEKREERREERAEKREEKKEQLQEKKKSADPGVNKRQRRQGSRIVGGVKSGQLTQQEVDALSAREANFRTLEANAKSDGSLTEAERKSLHEELNAMSKQIRSEKHDADKSAPLQVKEGNDGKAAAAKARRLGEVRRELNKPSLTPEQRAALETEHASIVDELFEEQL